MPRAFGRDECMRGLAKLFQADLVGKRGVVGANDADILLAEQRLLVKARAEPGQHRHRQVDIARLKLLADSL